MKVWGDEQDERELAEMLYDRHARDNSAIWTIVIIVVALALLVLAAFAMVREVRAHSFYEPACCSDDDCAPLPDGAVKITADGYVWNGTLFPFGSPKLRVSPDGEYHGCEYWIARAGKWNRPCLYVPPAGA